jgi:hypothetical protein
MAGAFAACGSAANSFIFVNVSLAFPETARFREAFESWPEKTFFSDHWLKQGLRRIDRRALVGETASFESHARESLTPGAG